MASNREKIKLESTAGTGTYYVATVNKKRRVAATGKAKKEKLELKKFDKKLKKHVLFIEKKLSK